MKSAEMHFKMSLNMNSVYSSNAWVKHKALKFDIIPELFSVILFCYTNECLMYTKQELMV